MYHLYTSEAFVLKNIPSGEADAYVFFLTPTHGVVGARARSSRALSSKMRFALQDFSYLDVTLVRGKKEWRITNVTPRFPSNGESALTVEAKTVFARIARLVKMLAGESPSRDLFLAVHAAYSTLGTITHKEELLALECITALKILHILGYVAPTPILDTYLRTPLGEEILSTFSTHKKDLLDTVNMSLEASHLSTVYSSV